MARYLRDALGAHLPGRWVTGNICMYWEPENVQRYAAPDVLVVDGPAREPLPTVYLKWSDPPALLVVEIGSKSTFLSDEGPQLGTYAWRLAVPE
ncbi:MAG: Uma2 family endonuclease [Armatimonadetes bacterium]|nr:Uma2 family endonuclease [Armatimonadota bacterium]